MSANVLANWPAKDFSLACSKALLLTVICGKGCGQVGLSSLSSVLPAAFHETSSFRRWPYYNGCLLCGRSKVRGPRVSENSCQVNGWFRGAECNRFFAATVTCGYCSPFLRLNEYWQLPETNSLLLRLTDRMFTVWPGPRCKSLAALHPDGV